MTTAKSVDPPPSTPPPNKDMIDMGITYAWNWTDSNNKSINQYANFWLLISAFVITADLAALTARPVISAAVAIMAAISALVFLTVLRQLQSDIALGEQALIKVERIIADELNVDELRLAARHRTDVEKRYNVILVYVIYMPAALIWAGAAVYALIKLAP